MMCGICGCGEGQVQIDGKHHHVQPREIAMERDIMSKNDGYAGANRDRFRNAGVLALNLVSSPGAGKTALLVKTLQMLGKTPCAVIEGDQQTANDADRIRATGVPAVQINTGKGCHLDAHMVGHAVDDLAPQPGSLLFIENVGNLLNDKWGILKERSFPRTASAVQASYLDPNNTPDDYSDDQYLFEEFFDEFCTCTNLPLNYLNDLKFGADEKEFHFTSQMQREELLRACFPGFPHNIWIQGF